MRSEEQQIQIAIVNWLRAAYPQALFTASAGGMRTSIGTAIKMKRMGYVAGCPDLLIFECCGGFHGLMVELKTETGKLDHDGKQKAFLDALSKRGYHATVCYGFKEAEAIIKNYLSMPSEQRSKEAR